MVLQPSGQISISDIRNEFSANEVVNISLKNLALAADLGKTTQIRFSDFYGRSACAVQSYNVTNYNDNSQNVSFQLHWVATKSTASVDIELFYANETNVISKTNQTYLPDVANNRTINNLVCDTVYDILLTPYYINKSDGQQKKGRPLWAKNIKTSGTLTVDPVYCEQSSDTSLKAVWAHKRYYSINVKWFETNTNQYIGEINYDIYNNSGINTHTINNLKSGTTYTIHVTPMNGNKVYGPAVTVNQSTLVPRPNINYANLIPRDRSIQVSWLASNVTKIYCSWFLNPNPSNRQSQGNFFTSDSPFTITGLEHASTYKVELTPHNDHTGLVGNRVDYEIRTEGALSLGDAYISDVSYTSMRVNWTRTQCKYLTFWWRNSTLGEQWQQTTLPEGTTSRTFDNIYSNCHYEYQLIPHNANDNGGDVYRLDQATPLYPATVISTSIGSQNQSTTISWEVDKSKVPENQRALVYEMGGSVSAKITVYDSNNTMIYQTNYISPFSFAGLTSGAAYRVTIEPMYRGYGNELGPMWSSDYITIL